MLYLAPSFWRLTQVHGMTKATDPISDAFLCEYQDGKGMDDLMKVIEVWKPVIAKMKNGDAYSVRIATPIAAQNMNRVAWVGAAPSLATLGGLLDEYDASPETTKLDEMFEEVVDCESRRMSRATKVK